MNIVEGNNRLDIALEPIGVEVGLIGHFIPYIPANIDSDISSTLMVVRLEYALARTYSAVLMITIPDYWGAYRPVAICGYNCEIATPDYVIQSHILQPGKELYEIIGNCLPGSGLYYTDKVNLPPGTYDVTFTLRYGNVVGSGEVQGYWDIIRDQKVGELVVG
ncbi:hypothetical protein ES703_110844 [subsurface metagenome]